MKKVFIAAAKRSAIGSLSGVLSTVPASELGAQVVKDLLNTTKIPADKIDEVIVGNVLSGGGKQGVARQVSIGAGIDIATPAYAVNMVCGSGLKAVMTAFSNIQAGVGNVYIAGGTESMSLAPYLLPGARQGLRLGHAQVIDHIVYDALTDAFDGEHMGITAERVAEKYSISRQAQDEFSMKSQEKAISAVDSGAFKDEIVPITYKTRKGEVVVDTDEHPNRTTNLEKLSTLRPAFKKDGVVTAGNASGINDGAAFMVVVSEDALKEYNLQPMAEIAAVGQGGVDPAYMGLGPVPAIKNALNNGGLTLKDMDVIELNEAFAAQSLGVLHELSNEYKESTDDILKRTNLNGGAIALGHPVGASGARIAVTLLHLMKKNDAKYGLASLCIGGGMGVAVVFKQV